MGNFERLSVLVIVVIIVIIVIIALVQLTGGDDGMATSSGDATEGTPLAVERALPPLPVPGPLPGMADLPPLPGPPIDVPAPAPAPTPAPEPVKVDNDEAKPAVATTHVVASGETIGSIARKYYAGRVAKGIEAILKANPTVEPTRMRVGTKLVIPALDGAAPAESGVAGRPASPSSTTSSSGIAPGETYVVKRGDTLASISRRAYGTTTRWQDVWLANYDAIGDRVDAPEAGTRLTIPK